MKNKIRDLINNKILSCLYECCDLDFLNETKSTLNIDKLISEIENDLYCFSEKDPASGHGMYNILVGYTSFKAVMHYRIANAIIKNDNYSKDIIKLRLAYSLRISRYGKLLSGAEIHPNAAIGNGFILDHGFGTVIGETTIIGDDCYILGGVVLGARGIADNESIQRHPIIGDNVQIGSFSRLFGNIKIGNNVIIGSNCTITENILPNTIVTLRSECQFVRNQSVS